MSLTLATAACGGGDPFDAGDAAPSDGGDAPTAPERDVPAPPPRDAAPPQDAPSDSDAPDALAPDVTVADADTSEEMFETTFTRAQYLERDPVAPTTLRGVFVRRGMQLSWTISNTDGTPLDGDFGLGLSPVGRDAEPFYRAPYAFKRVSALTGEITLTPNRRAALETGLMYAQHSRLQTTRGQIVRPGEVIYGALLRQAEVVPAASPMTYDVRLWIGFLFDPTSRVLRYAAATTGGVPWPPPSPGWVHLQRGARGVNGPRLLNLDLTSATPLPYDTALHGVTRALTDDEIAALRAGELYVEYGDPEMYVRQLARSQILAR